MAFAESPLNLVRGPAKKPEWAQLIRLGGDRVAILFQELRKSVGTVEGIAERLHYSEGRWMVRYDVGGTELFTARISPGLLEAVILFSPSERERLLRMRSLSGTIKDAVRSGANEAGSNSIRLPLTDRRKVRSFASLVKAKSKLASMALKPAR
ncbi:MAG TPA: hypothetical protein VNG91_00345 [Terriglobia bacterium]|nr:hypothetical protein [Terriglobia bacterium]